MGDKSDLRLQRTLAARDAEFEARLAAAAAAGAPCGSGGNGAAAGIWGGGGREARGGPEASTITASGGAGVEGEGGDLAERLRLADERFSAGAWGASSE
jgi:hypothetical protein